MGESRGPYKTLSETNLIFPNSTQSRPEYTRCGPKFASRVALLRHKRDSQRHYICEGCLRGIHKDDWIQHRRDKYAYGKCHAHHKNREALLNHWRAVGCRKVCEGCLMGIID